MRYVLYIAVVSWWVLSVSTVSAADISFSVVPSNTPNDEATVVQAYIDGKGVTLNALEGTVGFLGKGADTITKVVVETGDSIFTLWPVQPLFDENARVIRFTAGSPESFTEKQIVFRMRVYSASTEPITVSWLSGAAYRGDGVGTLEGISSRSLHVKPLKGTPNIIRSTSDDREPPEIISADIAYDIDTYGDTPFISVYATDDLSGISHYEFIEYGVKTITDIGTYVIQDKNTREPILVVVYDKAGNSASIKVFTGTWSGVVTIYNLMILFALMLIVYVLYRTLRNQRFV